jgi:hypothetical protein
MIEKMNRMFVLFLAVSVCNGCGLAIHNRLYNTTDAVLHIRTSEEPQAIRPHESALLGPLYHVSHFSISNQTGTVWVYEEDGLFITVPDGYTTWSRIPNFPIQTATKVIAVKPDGRLYLLPRGLFHWKRKKYEERQPEGFPITPKKKEES